MLLDKQKEKLHTSTPGMYCTYWREKNNIKALSQGHGGILSFYTNRGTFPPPSGNEKVLTHTV